jgi:IS30 family transposase
MKKYKQLGLRQRYKIEALLSAGKNQSEIAKQLGVHRSTISRELSRNIPKRGRYAGFYRPEDAQKKTIQREHQKPRHRRFTYWQLQYIREMLRDERWSPELISERGKIEYGTFISHEWIYQYIWAAKHSKREEYSEDKDLHKYLKHHGRRRKRKNQKGNRGCIPNRIGIENRPKVVEKRSRYGDYEVDFMMSVGRKPGLIVLTDRSNLQTRLIKTNTKKAKIVARKIIARMKAEKQVLKTMTFDNDLGFAEHQEIGKLLDVDTYFTRPYTSQDKGTVENRIGQIRRFFPKGTDMSKVHANTIKAVERKLNRRPVRKFNYLTPDEKYYSLVAVDT